MLTRWPGQVVLCVTSAVASGEIGKAGPVITGDVARVVIVRASPGYADSPGHPGTGTVVWDLRP